MAREGEGRESEKRKTGRRWVFPLATAVLVPALLLGALELGLRAAGYGFSPRLFIPIEGLSEGAAPAWTTNPHYGWRFFPPAVARNPQVCSLPRQKGEGTVRIFVLGGSAAMGTPMAAFGFGRLLQGMLEDAWPQTRFEVVNAAMTAVNSHVVRDIAGECAARQPDLFLVYLGNNEVVGPWGPGTVFSGFSDHLAVIRASVWLKGTRTGQLAGRLAGRLGGGDPELARWRGMEMFRQRRVAADDPRLPAVYDHLRANLGDILAAGTGAGARVVVSTVATNLVDSPPFASLHRPGLSGDELERWQGDYDRAVTLLTGRPSGREQVEEAAAALERAAEIDDRWAEVHFLLAHAYRALERGGEAEEHFVLARDLDALRFRADSRINQVIREVAGGREEEGVHLIDGEGAVTGSVAGAGGEVFWEHVHLNVEGTYRLARAFYEEVTRLLAERLGSAPEPPSRERLAEQLGLTDRDRWMMASTILRMTSRPPFTDQVGHRERLGQLRRLVRRLKIELYRNLERVREVYRQALERRGDDLALRVGFAEFLAERGDHAEAAAQWEELLARVPGVVTWRTRHAFALADQVPAAEGPAETRDEAAREKLAAAAAELEGVVQETPGSAEARVNLGTVREKQGDLEGAEALYREAMELEPGFEPARLNLGALLARRGDLDAAEAVYRRALELDPASAEAHGRLGGVLERRAAAGLPGEGAGAAEAADQGLEAAAGEYLRALEIDPDLATFRNNLGYVRERQGRRREAAEEYTRAVASDPTYPLPYFNLGDLLLEEGLAADAALAYQAGLELVPGNHQARYNLGMALATLGEEAGAAGQFRLLLGALPDHPGALNNLAWILASTGDQELRDPEEALRLARRAEQVRGSDPQVLETLARALAANGRRREAAEAAERALEAARATGDETLTKALEERLRGLLR